MNRFETGFYPLSRGVSLSFERIFQVNGENDFFPLSAAENDAIKSADYVYVNVRTLYRSIHGSLADGDENITPAEMAVFLEEEINNLNILFARVFKIIAEVVFYFPSYSSLREYLPHARLKDHQSTPIQKRRSKLESDTYAFYVENNTAPLHRFDCEITPVSGSPKILMLTHQPIDLLSAHNFRELHLLETNTGKVKSKSKFSTKLNKRKDESVFIPFNKMTMTVFGDGNKMVKPYAPTPKKELLAIARKYNWNSMTTIDRLRRTLREELNLLAGNTKKASDHLFVQELIKMVG